MKHRPAQKITSNLAVIRKRRGLSASALAKMVDVSRQTIYAIEGGSYIPNTAVGLGLARALAVSVEELFSLPESLPSERHSEDVTLLSSRKELHPHQPVQLCEVNGRLMAIPSAPPSWYLPPSDAVISGRPRPHSKAKVHLHARDMNFRDRILLAGCDPAMAVLADYLQSAGVDLVLFHQNSSQSLSLLKRGHVHIAGTHLRNETTGEPNVSTINRLFPAGSVAAVSFAMWEEGLVLANGNPKHIKGVEDLARKDVTFLNRESGAGSRLLLDNRLKRLKLGSKCVRGYNDTAPGHLAGACEVMRGAADCCIANGAAARVFGLDFIPLETSRYDLVVRKRDLQIPGIQALFNVMNRLNFRRELNSVAGYNTTVMGGQVL